MAKTAQISLFIIVGLILVLLVGGGVYFLTSNKVERTGTELLSSQASFDIEKNTLQSSVQDCLERETEEGMRLFSIREDSAARIAEYIEVSIPYCVDFGYYEERGFSFVKGRPSVEVNIEEDVIIANLNYPITMKRASEQVKLREFIFTIPRLKRGALSLDPVTLATIEPLTVNTEDGGTAELAVPVGVKATAADGTPIREVSIKLVDKNFLGLTNSVLVGKIVYEGLPDGARFSSPVTIRLAYEPSEIPAGMTVYDLSIAYYDQANGIWKGLPTKVDTVNHLLIAQTTHFTHFGTVAKCTENIQAQIITTTALPIYVQRCGRLGGSGEGTCANANWEYDNINPGLHEKQSLEETQDLAILLGNTERPYGQLSDYDKYDSDSNPEDGCMLFNWDQDDMVDNLPIIGGECVKNKGQSTEETVPYVGDISADCDTLWDLTLSDAAFGQTGAVTSFWKDTVWNDYWNTKSPFSLFKPNNDGINDTRDQVCEKYLEDDNTCKLRTVVIDDSNKDILATLKTYGYPGTRNKDGYVAGYGTLYFKLAERGDSCVADETSEPGAITSTSGNDNIWISLKAASLSPDIGEITAPDGGFALVCQSGTDTSCTDYAPAEDVATTDIKSVVRALYFNPPTSFENLELGSLGVYDTGIHSGLNKVVLRLRDPLELGKDTTPTPDGCLRVSALLSLIGVGITPQEAMPCTAESTTVSQRLNYLCGCIAGQCPNGAADPEYAVLMYLQGEGFGDKALCDPALALELPGLFDNVGGKCDGANKICRQGQLAAADVGCYCNGQKYDGYFKAECTTSKLDIEGCAETGFLDNSYDKKCACAETPFSPVDPDAKYVCRQNAIYKVCPQRTLLSSDEGCRCYDSGGNSYQDFKLGKACASTGQVLPVCPVGDLIVDTNEACLCGGKNLWNPENNVNNVCSASGTLKVNSCRWGELGSDDSGCMCGTSTTPFAYNENQKKQCTDGTTLENVPCPTRTYLLARDKGCECGSSTGDFYDGVTTDVKQCNTNGLIAATCRQGTALYTVDNGCTCGNDYTYSSAMGTVYCDGSKFVTQDGTAVCGAGPNLIDGCDCHGEKFKTTNYATPSEVYCNADGLSTKSSINCPPGTLLLQANDKCLCGSLTFTYDATWDKYCSGGKFVTASGKELCNAGSLQENCDCHGETFISANFATPGAVTCEAGGLVGTKNCVKDTPLYESYDGCYCPDETYKYDPAKLVYCTATGLEDRTTQAVSCPTYSHLWSSNLGCYCGDESNVYTEGTITEANQYYNSRTPPTPEEDRGVFCNSEGVFKSKDGSVCFNCG